ncbi:hypothetical protein [Acaryochloris sp. IP29b_bin.148]|uniref:hypothetical protein n=1 Tax=Acaryochloris sp. IP29b_bin.148 TaxID=2969218 RepID=UPI002605A6B0|nr:hypothetical protein [Acaryochloris sp. IP29b_bin.148]
MKLKSDIDKDIQLGLIAHGITFPIDDTGKIAIHEFRIDTQARIGMLYILPKTKLPDGALPFLVIPAQYLYGVFHFERQAAIIEIGTMALDGEIEDWYIKNKG